ncbi:methyl-accepting chemotaxis protein [Celerinatantimonas yamalensis]|uniref:Methyl-accepting chemotaxis protein n=1 Tax=Celerinatantimonas yamalensis TaxID=559956 RepID=A0ABW9GAQ5_9GAMM
MQRFFENISMGSKLALGFGMVLMLTIIVSGTGLYGVTLLVEQSHSLQTFDKIGNQIPDLRESRQNFFNSHKESEAEIVLTKLKNYKAMLGSNRALLGKNGYQNIFQQVENYQTAFQGLHEQINKADAVHKNLNQNLEQIVAIFPELMQEFASVNDLKSVLDVNKTERIFALMDAKLRSEGVANQPLSIAMAQSQIAQIQANISSLKASNSIVSTQLEQLHSLMAAYLQSAEQYAQLMQKALTHQQSFKQIATKMDKTLFAQLDKKRQEQQVTSSHISALMLIVSLIAIVLGTFFGWMIRHLTVKPMTKVVALANSFAAGHLLKVDSVTRKDELGQLLNLFAKLSHNLRHMIGDIIAGVEDLTSSVEQLSNTAERNTEKMTHQHQETDQVATAINEMAATVHEVANHAESTAQTVTETEHKVGLGNEMVVGAVALIQRLAKDLSETTDAMEELKQDSDRVGTILKVIKDVADQTNLLALNAAIEAARAGEAGRGFAVVADEVRNLASRTQQSAKEIDDIINSLQGRADRSLSMIVTSRDLSTDNAEKAQGVQIIFSEISQSMAHLQDMSLQIATAAEEQSNVSEEINQRVISVRDLADETTDALAESKQAIVGLNQLSVSMKKMTDRFKLN